MRVWSINSVKPTTLLAHVEEAMNTREWTEYIYQFYVYFCPTSVLFLSFFHLIYL